MLSAALSSVWGGKKIINDSRNMVDFRHSSSFMRRYLRRGEYLCRGSLRVERNQTFSLCFLFLWGVGETMLIKTYLCLAEQQCIWYSLKKRLWYLRYGVLRRLTPLCSLVHFPVAYWSFFWDCLWDCVSKRRPIDFPFRGFCRSRGLSLTINIKHVIK